MLLALVPRGPGGCCRLFQRRLLPLSLWSLILPGAREISPNESCSEIGLLRGKASVLVNQQFLMKNLLSENSQEAPALTSERCLPQSTLLGFMVLSHGLLFYCKQSCWTSSDYPSGQGSKSAVWDCPNLHDLTQVLAVGWVCAHIKWFLATLRLLRVGVHLTFSRPASSFTCSGEWS